MPTATAERTFQVGDRVRCLYRGGEAISYRQDVYGELGTVVEVRSSGVLRVRLDCGVAGDNADGCVRLSPHYWEKVEEPAPEEPFPVGTRVRVLDFSADLPNAPSAGDLGTIIPWADSGNLRLVAMDDGSTNGHSDGWYISTQQLAVHEDEPEDSSPSDQTLQPGDRVRVRGGASISSREGTPGTGDIGTVVSLLDDHGPNWLIRFDSGSTNGFTEGWYVRQAYLDKVEEQPDGFRVGDRVRYVGANEGIVTPEWIGHVGTVTAPAATGVCSVDVQWDEPHPPGRPASQGVLVTNLEAYVEPVAFDPTNLQVGDRFTLIESPTHGMYLIPRENFDRVHTVTRVTSLGRYIFRDELDTSWEVRLEMVAPPTAETEEPTFDPESLEVGDRFTLVESPTAGRYGIDAGCFGQTYVVVSIAGSGNYEFRDHSGYLWIARKDMAAPPDAPAPAPTEQADRPDTIHDIHIEFVLNNACTAEASSIQHYLRSHLQDALYRADADSPLALVTTEAIHVDHAERTTESWSCPSCDSEEVTANVTFRARMQLTTELEDDGDNPHFPSVDPYDHEVEWDMDEVEFSCGNGCHVRERTLADAGIDTDIEVY